MRSITRRKVLLPLTLAPVLALSAHRPQDPLSGKAPWPEPSPQHELLRRLEGIWDVRVRLFAEPGKPPVESPGIETVRSVCQGLWYTVEIDCDKKGLPYQGFGILGYDPARSCYTALWADVTSPLCSRSDGQLSSDRNRLTFTGEGPDPREPQRIVKFRQELEFGKKNERTATLSYAGADGVQVEWMTVDYTLKKRR